MRHVPLVLAVATALGSAPALAALPAVPGDLRVDVYSDTAAELFRNRSTDPEGLLRGYEIRRDGELFDTRDRLSHFTDLLTEGRAFAFNVTYFGTPSAADGQPFFVIQDIQVRLLDESPVRKGCAAPFSLEQVP